MFRQGFARNQDAEHSPHCVVDGRERYDRHLATGDSFAAGCGARAPGDQCSPEMQRPAGRRDEIRREKDYTSATAAQDMAKAASTDSGGDGGCTTTCERSAWSTMSTIERMQARRCPNRSPTSSRERIDTVFEGI